MNNLFASFHNRYGMSTMSYEDAKFCVFFFVMWQFCSKSKVYIFLFWDLIIKFNFLARQVIVMSYYVTSELSVLFRKK